MKKLIICGLSVIVLAACGGDDEATVTPQPQPQPQLQSSRMLTVEVSEKPMQDENTSSREANLHRASVTTTASLSPFKMHAEDWSQTFTNTVSGWTSVLWPSQEYTEPIAFYAHKGGEFNWNSGSPYLSFSMGSEAATQTDLLVATDNTSYDARSGRVELAFHHACAAVQFYVYKEEESVSYVVKSIELKGVKTEGEYHYADNSWKEVKTKSGTPYDYTLNNGDVSVTTDKQLLPCGWLFVIPQEKDGIQIVVTYTKDSGSEKTKTMSLASGSWVAGKQYTVNIRIGKAAS